jgi:hypothetical protein
VPLDKKIYKEKTLSMFYYHPTPNPKKATLFLEEAELLFALFTTHEIRALGGYPTSAQ